MSIVSIGVLVTVADQKADKSQKQRENEPLIIGYVTRAPLSSLAQKASSCVWISSYSASRILSIGLLFTAANQHPSSAAITLPVAWLAFECLLLAGVRALDGTYQFYRRELNNSLVRVVIQCMYYVAVSTAPFPFVRLPNLLTPHIYSG